VRVSKEAGDEELQRATVRIRENLIEAETRAFAHLSREPDW
jgi:hypothetical protein